MKISVCIPTYNQDQYLAKAVLSAYHQTLRPFEIIVSNDCSTDNTRSVLNRLQEEIVVLKVIHQPVNLGIAKNVDACLRAATGEYIVRLDSDDFLEPHYTEKLIQQMELYPEAGYAHAAVQEVDQFGNKTKIRKLSRNDIFQTGDVALKLATKGFKVAANIILFRREVLEKVHFVSSKANFAEDFYMITAISALDYGNIYLNEVLSDYRVWTDSHKVRQKRKLDEIKGLKMVIEEVIKPAFESHKWSLSPVRKMQRNFAINHSSCLGWNVYTKTEKDEIIQALFQLSESESIKLIVWIYMNKLGFILNLYSDLKILIKTLVKNILFRFQQLKLSL